MDCWSFSHQELSCHFEASFQRKPSEASFSSHSCDPISPFYPFPTSCSSALTPGEPTRLMVRLVRMGCFFRVFAGWAGGFLGAETCTIQPWWWTCVICLYWWFQPLRKKMWNICHWGSSQISILYDCFAFFMFISTNGFNHRNHQPNWVSDTSSTSFHVQSPARSSPWSRSHDCISCDDTARIISSNCFWWASWGRRQHGTKVCPFGILFANHYSLPSTINIDIIYELWYYDSPCNKNHHEPSFFMC